MGPHITRDGTGEQEQVAAAVDAGAERNWLLRALPAEDADRLRAAGDVVPMPVMRVVYEPDQPITHVFFPRTGVISMVKVVDDGDMVEVAVVGPEGMVGLPVFFGTDAIPLRTFSQLPGESLRVPAEAFAQHAGASSALQRVLFRYAHALFNQVAQTAACNRLHTVEERLARWLLMTADRASSEMLPLTQQFLAEMLGTRRAGVTIAAGTLQKAGFIRYSRGRIHVEDRAGLERAACACYRAVRSETERLLGGAPAGPTSAPSPLDGLTVSADGNATTDDDMPRRPADVGTEPSGAR